MKFFFQFADMIKSLRKEESEYPIKKILFWMALTPVMLIATHIITALHPHPILIWLEIVFIISFIASIFSTLIGVYAGLTAFAGVGLPFCIYYPLERYWGVGYIACFTLLFFISAFSFRELKEKFSSLQEESKRNMEAFLERDDQVKSIERYVSECWEKHKSQIEYLNYCLEKKNETILSQEQRFSVFQKEIEQHILNKSKENRSTFYINKMTFWQWIAGEKKNIKLNKNISYKFFRRGVLCRDDYQKSFEEERCLARYLQGKYQQLKTQFEAKKEEVHKIRKEVFSSENQVHILKQALEELEFNWFDEEAKFFIEEFEKLHFLCNAYQRDLIEVNALVKELLGEIDQLKKERVGN